MPAPIPPSQTMAPSPTADPPSAPTIATVNRIARLLLETLPVELTKEVYRALPLFIDQLHLVQALILAGEGERAVSILVQVVKDEFFLNNRIVDYLFGSGGIVGHNGKNPQIPPTVNDPYNEDGSIERYGTLIRLAK